MCREAVVRVETPFLVDGFQFGQFVAMRLDERFFVGSHFLLDGNGLISRRSTETLDGGAQCVQIEVQAAGNRRQIGVHIVVLLAHQEAGDGGVVVDDQAVFTVEELTARREHGHLADAVLLGQKTEVGGAEHLQAPQSGGKRQHHQQNAVLHHRQLNAGDLFAACCLVKIHGSAFSGYSEFSSGYSNAGAKRSNFGASSLLRAPLSLAHYVGWLEDARWLVELVVGVFETELAQDAARCLVRGVMSSDNRIETECAECIVKDGARRFRCETSSPKAGEQMESQLPCGLIGSIGTKSGATNVLMIFQKKNGPILNIPLLKQTNFAGQPSAHQFW